MVFYEYVSMNFKYRHFDQSHTITSTFPCTLYKDELHVSHLYAVSALDEVTMCPKMSTTCWLQGLSSEGRCQL